MGRHHAEMRAILVLSVALCSMHLAASDTQPYDDDSWEDDHAAATSKNDFAPGYPCKHDKKLIEACKAAKKQYLEFVKWRNKGAVNGNAYFSKKDKAKGDMSALQAAMSAWSKGTCVKSYGADISSVLLSDIC